MTDVVAAVVKELQEMQKLGLWVSAKALSYPERHPQEMAQYYVSMSVGQIADFVIQLAQLEGVSMTNDDPRFDP